VILEFAATWAAIPQVTKRQSEKSNEVDAVIHMRSLSGLLTIRIKAWERIVSVPGYQQL